ncbi:MAG: undecaprenyldiphospho-muramoylpentapeptide beta-N-acetylglucosaminyltransferase [Ruminococcaceae bacterium]|nr:undecaprenyldiphospho-muramoylpentapeptide beta-N-acetylglucosaminyltransferase [Oscillospiraceae bacterium]
MKVLISGGGTAGHINPAIAIGTYLQNQGAEVLYIGSDGALEKKLYSKTGCQFYGFPSQGLDRKHLLRNFKILATDYQAHKEIKKVVEKFRPDVGVSTGGYISALAMYALKSKKIPFLVHEQNAIPGLTTKLLSKWAKCYALAFMEAQPFLKHPDRAVLTGNPIRQEFMQVNKKTARQKLNLPEDAPAVLCFGGSLGALQLNEAFIKMIPQAQKAGITMFIGTGSRYYEKFLEQVKELSFDPNQIRITQYIEDMPNVLAACDVAITRAGAMTVSELCAMKKPAILIPSPNVTANHQDKNAHALVTLGGALKIPEATLTGENLYQALHSMVSDSAKLQKMSEALTPLAITDGDKRVGELVMKLHNQP